MGEDRRNFLRDGRRFLKLAALGALALSARRGPRRRPRARRRRGSVGDGRRPLALPLGRRLQRRASRPATRAHNVPVRARPEARGEVDLEGEVRGRLRGPGRAARRRSAHEPARPRPLQPLRRPAVRARLPDEGDLAARRRHRRDGPAPLHRLPVLRRRLPLRLAQLQLGRPEALSRQGRSGISRRGRRASSRNAPSASSAIDEGRLPLCVEGLSGEGAACSAT